jgi:hypothetical protein
VRITQDDISREKAKGNANNDWVRLRLYYLALKPRTPSTSQHHYSFSSHVHHNPQLPTPDRSPQVLTQRLVAAGGVATATLEAVTAKFEELYQGTPTTPGLYTKERLIVPKVGGCVAVCAHSIGPSIDQIGATNHE